MKRANLVNSYNEKVKTIQEVNKEICHNSYIIKITIYVIFCITLNLLIWYHLSYCKVVENELADNKYSEYLMKLFKNRDLQSKSDKKSDENVASKPEAGNAF